MAHNSFVSSDGRTERAHHTSYPCPPANESESLLINQLLFIDITCICYADGKKKILCIKFQVNDYFQKIKH